MVGAARVENRGGRLTRLALIECAERMFSQRGIDAVSVAEILDAAGQRNKNAVHYHFGGKEALVTAIAEHRSRSLNARRAELLSELRRRGSEHDIRALCTTLVEPLAELLDADGCHFLGFLARYHLDRSRRELVASVDPRVTGTYRDAYRMLAEASGLSRSAMEIRFEIAMGMIFTSLASRQTQESSSRGSGRVSRGVFVGHLVAGVTGCFTTPNGPVPGLHAAPRRGRPEQPDSFAWTTSPPIAHSSTTPASRTDPARGIGSSPDERR